MKNKIEFLNDVQVFLEMNSGFRRHYVWLPYENECYEHFVVVFFQAINLNIQMQD